VNNSNKYKMGWRLINVLHKLSIINREELITLDEYIYDMKGIFKYGK
jgi:hypothetical protein